MRILEVEGELAVGGDLSRLVIRVDLDSEALGIDRPAIELPTDTMVKKFKPANWCYLIIERTADQKDRKFHGLCTKCQGCGQVANTDAEEPWSQWADLPSESSAAVIVGLVKPITCPDCNGSGMKSQPLDKLSRGLERADAQLTRFGTAIRLAQKVRDLKGRLRRARHTIQKLRVERGELCDKVKALKGTVHVLSENLSDAVQERDTARSERTTLLKDAMAATARITQLRQCLGEAVKVVGDAGCAGCLDANCNINGSAIVQSWKNALANAPEAEGQSTAHLLNDLVHDMGRLRQKAGRLATENDALKGTVQVLAVNASDAVEQRDDALAKARTWELQNAELKETMGILDRTIGDGERERIAAHKKCKMLSAQVIELRGCLTDAVRVYGEGYTNIGIVEVHGMAEGWQSALDGSAPPETAEDIATQLARIERERDTAEKNCKLLVARNNELLERLREAVRIYGPPAVDPGTAEEKPEGETGGG